MGNFSLLTTLTLNAAGFTKGIDQAKKDTKILKDAAQNATASIKSSFETLAAPIMEQFSGLQKITGGFGGVAGAAKNMLPVLGLLKTAMIAIPLFAIITAIISLITWFKKTNEGTDIFTKAINFVGAIIKTILGTLKMLGEAIIKLFKGDFSGAAESAGKAFSSFGDRLKNNIDRARELSEALKAQRKEQVTEERELASLSREASQLWEKATDSESYTAQQRLKYLKEYQVKMKEIRDMKLADIYLEEKIYLLSHGGLFDVIHNDVLAKEYNGLIAKRNLIEAEYSDAISATHKKQKTITAEVLKQRDLVKEKLDLELENLLAIETAQKEANNRGKQEQKEIKTTGKPISLDTEVSNLAKPDINKDLGDKTKSNSWFDNIKANFKESKLLAKDFEKAINGIGDAFIAMAEGGKFSFKDMIMSMLDGIRKVITGLLAESLATAIINAFKSPASAATGGLAGIALAAAGITAVTALFASLPKFAGGGISAGGLSIVGERGAELVNLPSGSQVFSNSQSKNLLGGSGGQVRFEIEGTKLVGVLNNYNNRLNRIS
jgi:hypothetical protein